jgi:PAS domain S-box-containing protein
MRLKARYFHLAPYALSALIMATALLLHSDRLQYSLLLLGAIGSSAVAGGVAAGLITTVLSVLFYSGVMGAALTQAEALNAILLATAGALLSLLAGRYRQTQQLRLCQQRLQDQERLREAQYRSLAKATSDIIWDASAAGEFVTEQPSWAAFTAQSFEEYRGWGWLQAIHPDDRAATAQAWSTALVDRTLYHVEYRLRRFDGEYRDMSVRAVPVLESDDKVREWVGVHTDISEVKRSETERRQAQAALQDTNQTLQALIHACPLAITVFSLDGIVQLWNPAAESIFGWREAEALGMFLPCVPEARREEFLQNLDVIRWGRSIAGIETRRQRRDGETIDVQIWAAPLRNAQGNMSCMSILADVSERKRVEAQCLQLLSREQAARAESEHARAQLFKTLESVTDGFIALDPDWRFTYVNSEGAHTLGRAAEDLIGKNVWEEFPELAQTSFGQLYQRAAAEQVPLELEDYYPPFDAWFAVRAYPSTAGLVLYFRNITIAKQLEAFRKRAEASLRQSEERLRQALHDEQAARAEAEAANRLKDEFLATLSHELRTPLNAMMGWTQMLLTRRLNATTTAHALETIDRNTRSLSHLIEDLLDVSRIITGKLRLNLRPVQLRTVVEMATGSLTAAATAKNIDLVWEQSHFSATVMGDANRLQQVVWNLLSNAIKFTPAGGRVEVYLFPVSKAEQENAELNRTHRADADLPAAPNEFAQITVKDTGKGIAPEFLPYVFDRFRQADGSTTRFHGGLGLGMAIVHHVVEMHGGTVTARSAGEGQGATFTVRLPLLPAPQASPQAPFHPENAAESALTMYRTFGVNQGR